MDELRDRHSKSLVQSHTWREGGKRERERERERETENVFPMGSDFQAQTLFTD